MEWIDCDADDLAMQSIRTKPESLEQLVKKTKFTKNELRVMYRGFKQECPTGMVNEETFSSIFSHFFPQGDSTQYAKLVFEMFDIDKAGLITFEQFVIGLSILSRGSQEEKLRWAFNLYDTDNDGFICRDEMGRVIKSIYQLMGKWATPEINEAVTQEHVDYIFKKFDANKDGNITLDEFMNACSKDANILTSIDSLDTLMV